MGKRKLAMAAETPSPPACLLSSVDADTVLPRGKKVRATRVRQSISSSSLDRVGLPLQAVPAEVNPTVKRERHIVAEAVILDSVSKRLFQSEWTVKANSEGVAALELRVDDEAGEPLLAGAEEGEWSSLGVGRDELDLSLTLPTGQTFRWRHTEDGSWTGVVGNHIVSLLQTQSDVLFHIHPPTLPPQTPPPLKKRKPGRSKGSLSAGVANVSHITPLTENDRAQVAKELRAFLNLDAARLSDLYKGFSAADSRFASLAAHLGGARMLRQDPLECLFSFICSSNNHISRITGMVDHLSRYGDCLGSVNGHTFHKFPTVEQLRAADEDTLRAAGFGYRAKFIEGTVKDLLAKPEGGRQWLLNLRNVSLDEAVAELVTLPGIGPKVARCIALFSLDKHECIPVDTHVWQLAIRYYTPELEGKSLTPRVHQAVADAFVKVFGPYAGWAHNVLFIAELASMRARLPLHLHPPETPKKAKKAAKVSNVKFVLNTEPPAAKGEVESVNVDSPTRSKTSKTTKKRFVRLAVRPPYAGISPWARALVMTNAS
ncbi:DNA glycosylase [Klebsormidium nitens]|uniref:DNA-(apurinic or apyrimidinic site) lyase n=1 Tax=Klebsormidium nitens TaxID=105231 RepID=A0A1Y1HWS2_KLENI|nr:DNA glycosylase [Klebsormidium nitens]|eukprot:GAQ83085.1 DNA glycosylase [Klebsormidium nitens]